VDRRPGTREGRATSPARRAPNDLAKAKARIGELERLVGANTREHRPFRRPLSTIGSSQKAGPYPERSLPFVFDGFTLAGAVDLDASKGDRLMISPDTREVRLA
jgi:hypothetical protein